MSAVYDNWERLVNATLKREQLRLIALAPSRDSSFNSSISAYSNGSFSFEFDGPSDDVAVRYIFTTAIELANQVMKAADDASIFKQECLELKSKTQRLTDLLHQAALSSCLYDRPMHRIMEDTKRVLNKVVALVLKCCGVPWRKRVLTIIATATFRKMSYQLESSIGDVSWLLRISAFPDDQADEYLGLPPIACNEPILCLIWEQIAILYSGSIDDKGDAAVSLAALARESDRYGKLIIEEGGIGPLVKLVKEGTLEGQENAARAIGLLANNPEIVEHMIPAGVCSVFAKILKEGPMKVQAVVAWAVSELVAHDPKFQVLFAQQNIIPLVVTHLGFETVQEHSQCAFVSTDASTQQAEVLANATNNNHHEESLSLSRATSSALEMEDSATKVHLKAMAVRALWHLAEGNSHICQTIAESSGLFHLAVLLEEGPEEVRYNSSMALMEITAVAEEDADLRKLAFNPNIPGCKAVVDQLVRVIEKEDQKVLLACVKAIGNLARTISATETRMISPLVKLLDEPEVAEVYREACIALRKLACANNYLHPDHSKAIIGAGGTNHLVEIVYFGRQTMQICALILLCYIALHVPDSKELALAGVRIALQWASTQAYLMQVKDVEKLLPLARGLLQLHQTRRSEGFH